MNSIYLSHGGGPLPLMGHEGHKAMAEYLRRLAKGSPVPKQIIVVSAHWESNAFSVTTGKRPGVEYDYYGFPDEAYTVQYQANGAPELAKTISNHLSERGLKSKEDETKAFDHGVFVPLSIMYPDASIPVIQISLNANLDPGQHIDMGRYLAEVTTPDTLLIGSGFSFHNMSAFRRGPDLDSLKQNKAFGQWIDNTLSDPMTSLDTKRNALTSWFDAPSARFCHPREEHLLPLHVCFGAGEGMPYAIDTVQIMGFDATMVQWRE